MVLPRFNNLYGRIFAIFWLTILLILITVLSLPSLDPRRSKDLAGSELARFIDIRDGIELQFSGLSNLDKIAMHLSMHADRGRDRMRFFLTDQDGNLIHSETREDFKIKVLKNFITSSDSVSEPQKRLYGRLTIAGPFPVHLAQKDLLLYIAMRTDNGPPFIIRLLDNPLSFLLLAMIVSTPLLLWLAWALSKPANRLAQASQRVARGEFKSDPSLESGTIEFRQAGRSFNKMVEAVNGMISGQQRLLSDISHELRSPLTRLTMANALAKRKLGDSPELERIDTEARRLEQMIGELLELSRMQINSHMEHETQSLSSLWETMLDDAQFEAEQSHKTLRYSGIPNRSISGNPKLLISALENVIRNAIKYSEKQIVVSFHTKGEILQIDVEDDGPGVPAQELQDIFRPFYRVSTARDRQSGGAGLGLAITENAVRQHNGKLTATKSQFGGLKIEFELPLIK
ncbi:envelope stress sensor histidine kinase CpxA [Vibrio sp.]|uniref:histidine kinase n=1 Tax=Vibrio viridaestus TaxID=2487322 RepID=A0A3N9U0X1_9VIBR|nr:envelope stress sensor histidine kinase CpxA [Vibrio viridaestus]MDC0610067.1 envelope stress sensor histidine kinase CpxA [Vibrio sp.]RQW61336.1 envelope stress sensor histidine kinase CpxA [Vibrio viridaestus]